jgi:hypothetical protein
MLVRQLTGTATQAAQQAMARGGLGTITERNASGPHGFQVVDEEMLRSNPGDWFQRHIVGPQGYLRRMGLDPLRSSAAQIATAMRPLFSNQSAENIANMIINQRQEWMNQIRNALSLDLREETRISHERNSLWTQLTAVRSQASGALGEIIGRFRPFILTPLQTAADLLTGIAKLVNPRTGSDIAAYGLFGGAAVGGWMLARSLARSMGPLGRTAVGGGLGLLLGGGGVVEAVTGALLLRGMGGSATATAVTAAATAAAATWGGRFLAVAGRILRGGLRFTLGSIAIGGLAAVVENWEAVKTRLLAIWDELKVAAPAWAGGEGKGWGALGQNPQGLAAIPRDVEAYRQSWREWLMGTDIGQWMYQHSQYPMLERIRRQRELAGMGIDLNALEEDARLRAQVPSGESRIVNVTGNPISINITMPTGSNPQAVGEAAGNAVGSALRGVLGDVPALP